MSTTTPEPWHTAMEQRGISSIRDLARRSGASVETVRRLVQGSRKAPRDETLRAVADALGVPLATVSKWAGIAASDTEDPYVPPTEANRLTLRQREAVDELIRLLATKEAGGEHDQRSAPMKQAGESPASTRAPIVMVQMKTFEPSRSPRVFVDLNVLRQSEDGDIAWHFGRLLHRQAAALDAIQVTAEPESVYDDAVAIVDEALERQRSGAEPFDLAAYPAPAEGTAHERLSQVQDVAAEGSQDRGNDEPA
ncbi:helix-turn-helix domain-containing protein [Luteimicrobium sp. NPDC057192]|uniref:helix-turn-helix domain-containing protein n=1 Tax=Luteimicrobium sp. NPDC057192 TaxID=3346042 RepID=UPI0036365647